MKKCTFIILLMKFPSKMRIKGKDQENRVHFCDCGKGFNVVDAFLVKESIGNQMILMAFNITIRSKLGLIDPLTLHTILFV